MFCETTLDFWFFDSTVIVALRWSEMGCVPVTGGHEYHYSHDEQVKGILGPKWIFWKVWVEGERPQWFSYRICPILGKDKSLCLLQNDIHVKCLQFNDFQSVVMPSVWLIIVVHLLFIRCAICYVSVHMHQKHMVVSLCVGNSVFL